jgi:hypothetical protein
LLLARAGNAERDGETVRIVFEGEGGAAGFRDIGHDGKSEAAAGP